MNGFATRSPDPGPSRPLLPSLASASDACGSPCRSGVVRLPVSGAKKVGNLGLFGGRIDFTGKEAVRNCEEFGNLELRERERESQSFRRCVNWVEMATFGLP